MDFFNNNLSGLALTDALQGLDPGQDFNFRTTNEQLIEKLDKLITVAKQHYPGKQHVISMLSEKRSAIRKADVSQLGQIAFEIRSLGLQLLG